MKQIMNWVLAATLTMSGASVMTSCSTDNDDNPAQEQARKNRKEFVAHTRSVMKDLAENLNFNSWNAANLLNQYFNQTVLNNAEFDKTLTTMLVKQCNESVVPVEEGSELAQMGYKYQGTIDLSQMKCRFTMKADNTGWDIEPTDDGFEILINGWNPNTQQLEQGLYKLAVDFSGDTFKQLNHGLSRVMGMAVVMVMPTDVTFAISTKLSGSWQENFSGQFKNTFESRTESQYRSIVADAWNVSGTIKSLLPAATEAGLSGDATDLEFAIGQDPKTHQSGLRFDFKHNGQSRVALHAEGTNVNGRTDLSQLTSSTSIWAIVAALLQGNSIDELTLTLNDDLTTTLSISDMQKVTVLMQEMATLRRSYTDEATIDGYTQQLNELVKSEMTCKGVSQTIPMRMVTQKIGVDYWPMPALNFLDEPSGKAERADENGYTPLNDLLDKESIEYGINIIDHAAEPMQQSIIVARQLVQFFNSFVGANVQSAGGFGIHK